MLRKKYSNDTITYKSNEKIIWTQLGGHSTSTYSSNYSGSEYEQTFRRLIRHSSLETIGTNITSADNDFVWIDSHSRLVELQHYPWNNHDVLRLLQQGRLKNQLNRISIESVPRLSYLLQRPLVRIASEAQRFARSLGKSFVNYLFKGLITEHLSSISKLHVSECKHSKYDIFPQY